MASSHSYTACPDSFDEFYNQRRRWTPSTLANQWHLLAHSWLLLRYGNTNVVHMFYIITMLMAGLVGPGGVFLMLVGGLRMISLPLWASFALNTTLISTFFATSLFCSKKVQLLVAKVLSGFYACIMMMIMFAIIIEAFAKRDECWLTPSTTTLIAVATVYLLAGVLHLLQIFDLLHGVVFYLTIPSMYMLLPFYCVFNLTDTTWGTREHATGRKKEQMAFTRDAETPIDEHGISNQSQKKSITTRRLWEDSENETNQPTTNFWEAQISRFERDFSRRIAAAREVVEEEVSQSEDDWEPICEMLSPVEMGLDEKTRKSREKELKEKIKKDLESLKVTALMVYLFVNIAFVIGIFLMQIWFEEEQRFSQDWPLCKISTPLDSLLLQNETTTAAPNTTFLAGRYQNAMLEGEPSGESETSYMQLDPINLVFIVFFLGAMFFQMAGMVFHRVRNAGHLMATISWSPDPQCQEADDTAAGHNSRAASEDGHQNADAEAQNETIDSEGQNRGAGHGNPHDETATTQIAEANRQAYRTESHAA